MHLAYIDSIAFRVDDGLITMMIKKNNCTGTNAIFDWAAYE